MTTQSRLMRGASAAAGLLVLMTGCSSPPKPVVPDGGQRVPVNGPERRAEFEATTKAASEDRQARAASDARLRALELELERMRQALVAMAIAKDTPTPSALTQTPKQPEEGSAEARGRSAIFRVRFEFASTDFVPSAAIARQLLAAAASGGRIEVRGRTDGTRPTPGEAAVARLRATGARKWLLEQGVPAHRIGTSWLAAGGHWAPNDTAAGRALNRRVEIEVMDVGAAVLAAASGAERAP